MSENFPYRWGSETVEIVGSRESAEEIMEILNDYQEDEE